MTPENRPGRGLARFARRTYQQVAAVFGAFSLLVLVGDLMQIGWRGFLARIVTFWAENVRPAVGWLLDAIIATPFRELFGWHVDFPVLLQDYVCVGLILAFSIVRETWLRPPFTWETEPEEAGAPDFTGWAAVLVGAVLLAGISLAMVLLWPILMFILLLAMVGSPRKEAQSYLLAFSPFVYLGILIAVNYLL